MTAGLYWNAILACVALVFHCIPFAAYEFIDDEGATGRSLSPLAPLALIIALLCCAVLLVQSILLFVAFRNRSPARYHRMTAIGIAFTAIGLIFVAGRFGWFIHV
jgi:heme/copper-type cytochrome/quinol oxidase subunit 3